ncbi:GNAT family N-acetyltransferase [Ramlibacter sp.]|uniref:GNAT family N-acetyltransferase n=1 Tax=Ramlibacter sp. TaxID=1917967 RepID=UPI0017A2EA57|nr:GNAT family N-acetyltransferase [Ramlibacter sp.]MBA2673321.1 acetyltransferase [Ramlibacter sp.]
MSAFDFRPIARGDFAQLAHWLRQPHVARWWADDPSPQALEADYGGVIDGTEPCDVFIALLGGRPFGLAQRLRWDAYPDYLAELQRLMPAPPGAYSIDYLVGEIADTGRGLGSAMVGGFVQRLWSDKPDAAAVIVPVHAHNAASWRVLERNGFRRLASGELDPDNPADTRDHHIYGIERPLA